MKSKYMHRQNDNNFYELINFWQNLKGSMLLFHSLFGGFVLPLLILPVFYFLLAGVDSSIYPLILFGNILMLVPFYLISFVISRIQSSRIFIVLYLLLNIAVTIFLILLSKYLPADKAYSIAALFVFPLWFLWKQLSTLFYNPFLIEKKAEFNDKSIFLFSRILIILGIVISISVVLWIREVSALLYVSLFLQFLMLLFAFKKYPKLEHHFHTGWKAKELLKKLRRNTFNKSVFQIFTVGLLLFVSALFLFLYTLKINFPMLGKEPFVFSYLSLFFIFIFFFVNLLRENAKTLINRLGLSFSMQIYSIILFIFNLLSLLIAYGLGFNNMLTLFMVSAVLFFEVVIRSGLYSLSLQVIMKTIHLNAYQFIVKYFPFIVLILVLFTAFLHGFFTFFELDELNKAYTMGWLIVFISIWHFLSNYKTYKVHRKEIINKALEKKTQLVSIEKDEIYETEFLITKLLSQNIEEVKLSVIILSEINAKKLQPYLIELIGRNNLIINKAVLFNLDYSFDKQLVLDILGKIHPKDAELEEQMAKLHQYFSGENSPYAATEFEAKLAIIKKIKENPKLLTSRIYFHPDQEHPFLIKSFIGIISDTKNPLALESLAHWLIHEQYSHYIADYLISIGDEVLPLIDNYFYHTNPPIELLIKVIEIYGKISGNFSSDYLISHLNYPNTYIQNMIIKTLLLRDYKPLEDNDKIFIRKIYFIVQNIAWLLNYRENFLQDSKTLAIIPAIDSEVKQKTESLFMLMELLFNRTQILIVRQNFEKGNNIYAAELLNSILSEELKNIILPIVENIPNYQKIRRLGQYFQIDNMSTTAQLIELIKASPLKIADSTRAKAIEVLSGMFRKTKFNKWKINYSTFQPIEWTDESIEKALKDISISNVPDEAYLGLFHHSSLVYTTAATILFNINPARTAYFLKNFNDNRTHLLDILENSQGQSDGTILEKIKYLKRLKEFENVSVDILLYLASSIEIEDVMEGTYVSFYRNEKEDIMWLLVGELEDEHSGLRFTKNSILISGLNAPLAALKVTKSAKLLRSNRARYFSTLVVHQDLIRNIFRNLFQN